MSAFYIYILHRIFIHNHNTVNIIFNEYESFRHCFLMCKYFFVISLLCSAYILANKKWRSLWKNQIFIRIFLHVHKETFI